MEWMDPLVQAYADQFTSPDDALLADIQQQTKELHPHAHLMSSPLQGKLLSFLSNMIAPQFVLELGTFTGYSALCLASGLAEGGELHTIECREEDATVAQKNFSKSLRNKQIHLHLGNAADWINKLDKPWDLVFIDADKTAYINYYELLVPKMKAGAWLIADNVLFHGQVIQEPLKGKNAKAIHAFNEWVAKDTRTEQILLPVRDGLMIIKKRPDETN